MSLFSFFLKMTEQTFGAIRYCKGSLQILDQLALPFKSVYVNVKNSNDGHAVIRSMQVRGAPAIAIVAALSLAVELHFFSLGVHTLDNDGSYIPHNSFKNPTEVKNYINEKLNHLETSRPTAVNLFRACDQLARAVERACAEIIFDDSKDAYTSARYAQSIIDVYINAAESMLQFDINDNKAIGRHGASFILNNTQLIGHHGAASIRNNSLSPIRVLTHCNTGSLATAGWGTALGIIRELHQSKNLEHVYCTETRPCNQGSRLTAYELVFEKTPATLVCDSMVSALLQNKNISAIIVGADRIAANGDTANKIGTFQLAIVAKHFNIPFIVAAPITTIDLATLTGAGIEIEERDGAEVTTIRGRRMHQGQTEECTIEIAAPGIEVWNPAFDVTPASLITAIVTERGVIVKDDGCEVFDIKSFLDPTQ